MRVSILIPTLNAENCLRRCLDSILSQTYSDVEVVVSDGASSDGTVDLLRQYQPAFGVRLIWRSEHDNSSADALNWAASHASGEWILVLGADDYLANPEVIGKAATFLEATPPETNVVVGHVQRVNKNGKVIEEDDVWSLADFRALQLILPFSSFLWRRSVFETRGHFEVDLRYADDLDFLLRELLHSEARYFPGLAIAKMTVGGRSNSRRYTMRQYIDYMRVYERRLGALPVWVYWEFVKAVGITVLFHLVGDDNTYGITNAYRRLVGNRPPLNY